MPDFPIASSWLREQLQDPGDGPPTFFSVGMDFYGGFLAEVERHGGRSDQANAAAARFGAHLRKFKAALKQKITEDLVKHLDIQTSRELVRQLQLDVFLSAQASKDLKRFADAKHSGWFRPAERPPVPVELASAAAKALRDHEEDLKIAVRGAFR